MRRAILAGRPDRIRATGKLACFLHYLQGTRCDKRTRVGWTGTGAGHCVCRGSLGAGCRGTSGPFFMPCAGSGGQAASSIHAQRSATLDRQTDGVQTGLQQADRVIPETIDGRRLTSPGWTCSDHPKRRRHGRGVEQGGSSDPRRCRHERRHSKADKRRKPTLLVNSSLACCPCRADASGFRAPNVDAVHVPAF